jgi:cobalamin biosynthesis protein CbiD
MHVNAEEVIEKGLEEKSKEFHDAGGEIYVPAGKQRAEETIAPEAKPVAAR